MSKKTFIISAFVVVAVSFSTVIFVAKIRKPASAEMTSASVPSTVRSTTVPAEVPKPASVAPTSHTSESSPQAAVATPVAPAQTAAAVSKPFTGTVVLVGPDGNVPKGAPKDGLKLFSVPVPGVLSRSAQPTLDGFTFLKVNGWKSIVDFREDGEKSNPYALDSKLPGFDQLSLKFLSIPIKDGTVPSDAQADLFLKFVTDPANQPVHVHCAAGIGRTGVAVALYRYSVQGWSMDKAIAEAGLYTKNLNSSQQDWLGKWAANHAPGSFAK
ncbi:MAG: protein-tyrosine phosphatase family protein [Candidatus Moraniibacteriota bacterium]